MEKFSSLHCFLWPLIIPSCKWDVNEWSVCQRPWSAANSPGVPRQLWKKKGLWSWDTSIGLCVCAYLGVCLCMYFILLAPANPLTPDGEQWVSRLYFLLDLILIDQYASLPHSLHGRNGRLPPPSPTLALSPTTAYVGYEALWVSGHK